MRPSLNWHTINKLNTFCFEERWRRKTCMVRKQKNFKETSNRWKRTRRSSIEKESKNEMPYVTVKTIFIRFSIRWLAVGDIGPPFSNNFPGMQEFLDEVIILSLQNKMLSVYYFFAFFEWFSCQWEFFYFLLLIPLKANKTSRYLEPLVKAWSQANPISTPCKTTLTIRVWLMPAIYCE